MDEEAIELCLICRAPSVFDQFCRECLRARAFCNPKTRPLGCLCPPTSETTCKNQECPRRPRLAGLYTSTPRIAEIQKVVSEAFSLRMSDMVSQRRARDVARPRQIAMFLAKELTLASLPMIGRAFGDRDHATVAHAIRTVREIMDRDISYAALIEDLKIRARGV